MSCFVKCLGQEKADRISAFFTPSEKTKEKAAAALKITLFVVAFLALTAGVLATLVHFKVLPADFPLNRLGCIGRYATGVLTGASSIITLFMGVLLIQMIKECCARRKLEAEASKIEVINQEIDNKSVQKTSSEQETQPVTQPVIAADQKPADPSKTNDGKAIPPKVKGSMLNPANWVKSE